MLEDQPLDLSVRVGDYAEFSREENDQDHDRKEPIDDYGNAAAALRLRGCFVAATSTEYSQEREDRTCSEDSDDSCSDNNQKDGTTRSRSRPPGTKPYKKNLMRRYRESLLQSFSIFARFSPPLARARKPHETIAIETDSSFFNAATKFTDRPFRDRRPFPRIFPRVSSAPT